MTVAVVKLEHALDSVRRAIALCDGFAGLNREDRVLLKPNLCAGRGLPPYGMVTTTTMLDALLQLLREHGCRNITIGEGTVTVLGRGTRGAFRWTHLDRLARRYGARLVDLNRGPFRQVDLGDVTVGIAEEAFAADFLINVPVLKTHSQVKVSLGLKNLKGFLDGRSRRRFHRTGRLDHCICQLSDAIRTDLTVIDGTYMLEDGPDTLLGTAYRKDLIVASRDVFACDVVGAALLGIPASDVGHLREFAESHGRTPSAEAVSVEGERDLAALCANLSWKSDMEKALLAPSGITGLSLPHPGDTACSGCYAALFVALMMIINDNPGADFGNTVIRYGRQPDQPGPAGKAICFGDCAVRSCSSQQLKTVRVEGCSPGFFRTLFALWGTLLTKPRMLRNLPLRVLKLAAVGLGLRDERLPRWERYRSDEFDASHFSSTR